MLVFNPATSMITRFTLARGLLNEGYYEMAREEILRQITRELGNLLTEQAEQIKNLPISALEELEEALWDLKSIAELKDWLSAYEIHATALQEARQEGHQAGIQEGEANLVMRLLTRRFGSLSSEQVNRIEGLSVPLLEELAEALLDFTVMADLEDWWQQRSF